MTQLTIYYVLNNRWPTVKAHGLQVAKTCQGLQRAGAVVHLIIPRRRPQVEIADVDPFELYGVRDPFMVTRLWSLDTTSSAVLFAVQQTLFALMAGIYLMGKCGVVYTRDPFTAFVLSFLRKGVFWEAHRFPANTGSLMYRRLFRAIDGIVVITHGLKKLFVSHGMTSERVAVISDAVDPDEFLISQSPLDARRMLGLPEHQTMVSYVGQLSTFGEGKGIDDLLRAFVVISQKQPNAFLAIVGGNEDDIARYRQVAETLGLVSDVVMFLGRQLHGRIPLYLRASDILVMPYPNTPHYAHYMSPLKLFEYLAAGKPIVATDLPSVREIVGDDDVFFVQPDDPDDLARGILTAIDNPELAIRKCGRSKALARRYSWNVRGQQILAFMATKE